MATPKGMESLYSLLGITGDPQGKAVEEFNKMATENGFIPDKEPPTMASKIFETIMAHQHEQMGAADGKIIMSHAIDCLSRCLGDLLAHFPTEGQRYAALSATSDIIMGKALYWVQTGKTRHPVETFTDAVVVDGVSNKLENGPPVSGLISGLKVPKPSGIQDI